MQNRGCFIAMVVGGSAALALSLSWFFYFLPQWKMLAASNMAFEIERRLEAYHRAFGTWPDGGNTDILLALRGRNPGNTIFIREEHGFPVRANAFIDQWEMPLVFTRAADGRPVPVSSGPNRKPGDQDDVGSAIAAKKAADIYGAGKIPPYEPEPQAKPASADGIHRE